MELITIIVPRPEFEEAYNNGYLPSYEAKEVTFKDDFFKGDPIHEQLKTASVKAYKALKEYEFKKRNP